MGARTGFEANAGRERLLRLLMTGEHCRMGLLKKSLSCVVAVTLWCSSAAAVTINDGYVGGDPTHAGDYG